ncbi:hypothetical protein ABZ137_02530 [Streptomyces bobili]|uniref:hypothetical protein n=1 Tax=Streptomyces bobili TaxID=67280 RepID=UPI0033B0CD45
MAGGTAHPEVLEGDGKRAGGAMLVTNRDPHRPGPLPKGTFFRSPSGVAYRSRSAVQMSGRDENPPQAEHRARP